MRFEKACVVEALRFPDFQIDAELCATIAVLPSGPLPVFCTRADEHSGRHAAGDGEIVLAVWGQR